VVAQLVDIEVVVDAGAERADDRLDFLVGPDAIDAGLLDVQDLATQRQNRLDLRVASTFGRTTCRITLDDEDLALLGVSG